MNEEIRKVAREAGLLGDYNQWFFSEHRLERFFHLAVEKEREACAKVADEFDPEMKMSNYGQVIANRIRARGQA